MNEINSIHERYDKRKYLVESSRYDPLNPSVYLSEQEKERAFIKWIKYANIAPVNRLKVLEIGCGSGTNLLQLLRLGFIAENLVGNELIDERAHAARERLPDKTKIIVGDASNLDYPGNSFDVVLQSTVFSSVLDRDFQQKLADHMWYLTKPGGGVLWYDLIYNNPWNQDVKGVPIRRVRELFSGGEMRAWRLTLAPPISRLVTEVHPSLYSLFNLFPFLRTHVLCWICKKTK